MVRELEDRAMFMIDSVKKLKKQVGISPYIHIEMFDANNIDGDKYYETFISVKAILSEPHIWVKGIWLDMLPGNAGVDPCSFYNLSVTGG